MHYCDGTDFTGNAMILTSYTSQQNLYEHQLALRCGKELNQMGEFFDFEKSRVLVRTHHGAQGGESDVVIIDLVRSDKPGFTSQAQVVNVVSSRAKFGPLIVMNDRVFGNRDTDRSRYIAPTATKQGDTPPMHPTARSERNPA
ncbi:hypothetical protein VMCG_08239 [Cytospora schulzeri]|uniref:DNA2/NAM7 helicase-like C-terminal domain-containing protein n=1 Tax=Cytospora schulzeri TaxID=448051 RepID=A0A423VSL5_9PEZI|nr:hypothetical protein VMCG_08239 [Valsa malicola]